ncbi:MAG: hypothetical protein ACT4P2_06160 [Pseudomonadota bacterium]
MFGLSFPKLLLLVAVVAIVWFGFRWFQRWERERREGAKPRLEKDKRRAGGSSLAAEDMTACPVCGAFVAERAASCGRRGCPYPG